MEALSAFCVDLRDPIKAGADSFGERLNCVYTVLVLIFLATAILYKQLFSGDPVTCWFPPSYWSPIAYCISAH